MGDKFRPAPTPETQTYGDKARLGELWLPTCAHTGRAFFPPRARSPFNGGPVSWKRASGRATLASYVVVHRASPGFEGEAPYVVAIVALPEGPCLRAQIDDRSPDGFDTSQLVGQCGAEGTPSIGDHDVDVLGRPFVRVVHHGSSAKQWWISVRGEQDPARPRTWRRSEPAGCAEIQSTGTGSASDGPCSWSHVSSRP
ncbi:Zn-ribbon domain-containing OB-fold protein [Streptomyces violaceusniger]|uniref:Zn-ribbon domain-containing OB-fold protein n=1 Tax=Streptomyces violaceusniger TaxID=68280 RepID=UPI003CD06C53